MMKAELHEILVRARNIMAERGLLKGALWISNRSNSPVCLRGALYTATNRWGAIDEAEKAMGFQPQIGGLYAEAVEWNNAPERTLEEVLARFDAAIAATAPEPDIDIEVPAEVVDQVVQLVA